jgi:Fe-S cluster assembly protein SufD
MPSVMAVPLSRELGRDFAVRRGEPEWLKKYRLDAFQRFEELPFPSRTDEEWRRTDISRLDFSELARPGRVRLEKYFEDGCAGQIVLGAAGVERRGDGPTTLVESGSTDLGSSLDRSEKKFSSLNDAFFGPGAAALVGSAVAQPLRIVSVFGGGALFPRSHVQVESGGSAVVLDELTGEGDGLVVSHGEIRVAPGGRLTYIRLQTLPAAANFETLRIVLGRDAVLQLVTVDLGGAMIKRTIDVTLAEEGASLQQKGIVAGRGTQHFDVHEVVDHAAPRTTSDLYTKSAVWDKARTVFVGLIRVRPGAQRIEAFETNRNLLLSPGARADSIPKLEILADDVKCGHASATGSVDADQLFYLQSRGLSAREAERLIVEGFFEDVLGKIALPEPAAWIQEKLRKRVIG